MRMKLNSLVIRNFKGIREFELQADGNNLNIYGDNATGKTTLYDAFTWLLFGKNSADQSDSKFDWKPLDEAGNEIHHLETEVIGEFEIDGYKKKLSRMSEEKWTKKRGSVVETFSGHTTTFKIDDLVVKKKEYEEYLSGLIDEDLFKLLTNVNYFPEMLNWKDRRETLINMVDDITDADVIKENKELEPLQVLIEERPADELKQLTQQNMRQINTDIKALPDRIDEVDRSLPDISQLDKAKLETQKEGLEQKIADHQEQIAEIKNSDSTVALKNELRELEIHYKEMEMKHQDKLDVEVDALNKRQALKEIELAEIDKEITETKRLMEDVTWEINQKQKQINELTREKEKMAKNFILIRDEKMEDFETHRTTCPTCGQNLPEDEIMRIQMNYEAEVKAFNEHKATRLKENQTLGKAVAQEIADLYKEKEELENNRVSESRLAGLQEQKEKLETEINAITDEIKVIRDSQNPFDLTEEAAEVNKQMKAAKERLEAGDKDVTIQANEVKNEIDELRQKLSEVDSNLQDITFYKRQVSRKDELIQQEQELSIEYGELEQRLHLLEEFTRTKVNLLTDTINSHFKMVKFKLFEEQINGGLSETCEVTVNGTNYSTGLNNAMKINAGLDIINTLMDHYETYVPVFIDNAESVNDLLDIDTQLITLSVSNHKSLRVEAA